MAQTARDLNDNPWKELAAQSFRLQQKPEHQSEAAKKKQEEEERRARERLDKMMREFEE